MTERPILFSAPMVRAILDGSKTVTRRIVKLPHNNSLGVWEPTTIGGVNGGRLASGETIPEQGAIWHTRTGDVITSPYGHPGDQLWVRETWSVVTHFFDADGDLTPWVSDRPSVKVHDMPFGNGYYSGNIIYRADGEFDWGEDGDGNQVSSWNPSIHMPRIASRIQLEIVSIRVERLQDISKEDAIAEGILPNWYGDLAGFDGDEHGWLPFTLEPGQENIPGVDIYEQLTPQRAYQVLWESINGAGSWAANPWVWCVEFRRIKP